MTALGPRHAEVQRLRTLLRDRSARRESNSCVIEGPKVLAGALDRGAAVQVVYLAPTARRAFAPLVTRVEQLGIRVEDLKEGVLEGIGTTVTPQPVAAIVAVPLRDPTDLVRGSGFLVVGVDLQDPGNVGTILRSAEASGADAVVLAGESVDVVHPKVVRALAGAVFGVPIADAADAAALVTSLNASGVRTLGAAMSGGVSYDDADLTGATAFVVGNEGSGLPGALVDALDGTVHIPMVGVAESLNVGVAASILCFEAARQRRVH